MRLKSLVLLAGALMLPGFAAHSGPTVPRIIDRSDSVPVQLDLYDGDKDSHAFSEGLRAAVAGDSRFDVVDALPANGLKMTMKTGISADLNNDAELASYAVTLKLGSGKFIKTTEGYCNRRKYEMCGRVVAEDSYALYKAYIDKHPQ